MVTIRLDLRLQGRIDASDVIQEAHLDIVKRIEEYLVARRCRSSSGKLLATGIG
jgi:hypothetical protein